MTYEENSVLVVDESNDIVYLSDCETYELCYLNRSAIEMLNLKDTSEWLGKKCYEVIQSRDRPCEFCTNRLLNEEKFYCWDFYNEKLKRHFSIKDKLVEIDGRKVRLELAVDTTEKEEAERQIRQKLHMEETLVSCIQTLNENTDIGQAIYHLLEIIGNYYKAERAYIFEVDSNGELMSNTYEWCREDVIPQINNLQHLPLSVAHRWFEQFKLNGEIHIDSLTQNVSSDSPEYEILSAQGIHSLMAKSLDMDGKVIGFLGVDNPSENSNAMMLMSSVATFIVNDINKRKMLEQLTLLSYSDSLTGLANRHKYVQRLGELEETNLQTLGIVYADINGLKIANDTRGHQYGNQMIKRAADLLHSVFDDDVFRIGGDEFVVLCPDVDRATFDYKVLRLRQACKNHDEFQLSIGVTWNADRIDVSKQVSHTDELMYIDKQTYYNSGFSFTGKHNFARSGDLVKEIKANRFVVFLQPKINIHTGEINGAEALVRKKGENGELILPAKFIMRYETEGNIRYVDFFVFNTVCSVLHEWQEQGHKPIKIAVNFSRVTLTEHDVIENLLKICEKHHVSPRMITIEVTESISIMEYDELRDLTEQMEKSGFSISLDDFGSKYSNLSILTYTNFNEVKLDKSLIDNMVSNRKSRIIIDHTIKMCRDFDCIHSVAEGIETLEQLEVLKSLNCNIGQGYYYDKPMPIVEFEKKYLNK